MNKTNLVDAVAEKAGLTKAEAQKAVNAFVDATIGALKAGDKVAIPGFGTFSVSERAARMGKNPRTGEAIKIEAKKSAKFKAGKGFDL